MNLQVRIVKELRAYFSEVRILKELGLNGFQTNVVSRMQNVVQSFELASAITQLMITIW